jgi:hypothetical protein
LSEVLRLCMRLGKQLGNDELIKWARSEATGYDGWDSLPDYRVLSTNVKGTFFGPFGTGLKNVGIPQAVVEKEHRENLFKAHMTEPVGELERLAKNESSLRADWSADAVAYYQQKEIYENGLALAAAWRQLTPYAIAGILETVRTRVLDFVLRIEGELNVNSAANEVPEEIDRPAPQKVDQIVHNIFYGASNVSVGNSGTVHQTTVNVQPGDLEGLKKYLKGLGLTNKLIEELDDALQKDQSAESQPGPSTQNWLGKVMVQIGRGTLSIASNAAGSLVADAVMRFLGIRQ